AQAIEAGADPLDFGIVRDDAVIARSRLLEAVDAADVVVTCGGVSMGKKDPFIEAFRELQVEIQVHGISIRPGKPFFFGFLRGKPIFGLPGNQASCSVTFELFVRPFLTRWLKRTDPDRLELTLPLAEPMKNHSGRDHFFRARVLSQGGRQQAAPLATQDSHLLTSMLGAQLLVCHPAAEPEWKAGREVCCRLID
ncbi:MAG TPA: molybdopterin-binding protein, partial [Candidatus Ozemobacteraceae bacterium]|nr:molybdopterin-binding protein [Candidatus Ozemobacteraceae bacterium]